MSLTASRFASEYYRTVATLSSSTGTENFHSFGFQAELVDLRNDSTSTGGGAAGAVYVTLTATSSTAASTGANIPTIRVGERLGPIQISAAGCSVATTSTNVNYRIYAWGGSLG